VAGTRGSRLFLLAGPPPAPTSDAGGFSLLRLHDRGPSTTTGADSHHDLAVAAPAVPPVLTEEA
jgi:hypothetical protein